MQLSNGGNASLASRWLTLDNFRTIAVSTEPKETWATPRRAGDVARNGGEARVSRVTPDISTGHDRDRVPLALVFAHQNGAGSETSGAIGPRPFALCEAVQNLAGFRIKPPESLFLDMPADEPGHEVLGEGRRRRGTQCRAPQHAKIVEAERLYAVDLGLDRLVIG